MSQLYAERRDGERPGYRGEGLRFKRRVVNWGTVNRTNWKLKDREMMVDMQRLDDQFTMSATDIHVNIGYNNVFHTITSKGLIVQNNGKELELTEDYEEVLTDYYAKDALFRCLFTYVTTGYFLFRVKYNAKVGQVIPYCPVFGSYVITDMVVAGQLVPKLYVLNETTGEMEEDPNVYVERLNTHDSISRGFSVSMGTLISSNRHSYGKLMDNDEEASRQLSNPSMVKVHQLPTDKELLEDDEKKEKEMMNQYMTANYRSVLPSVEDPSDIERKQKKKFEEVKAKLRADYMAKHYYNQLQRGETSVGSSLDDQRAHNRSLATFPIWNEVDLEPGMNIAHQVLPQRRNDLLPFLKHLRNELMELMGYVSPQFIADYGGRSLRTENRMLDGAKHEALIRWSRIASYMLTTFYRFIHEEEDVMELYLKKENKRLREGIDDLNGGGDDDEDADSMPARWKKKGKKKKKSKEDDLPFGVDDPVFNDEKMKEKKKKIDERAVAKKNKKRLAYDIKNPKDYQLLKKKASIKIILGFEEVIPEKLAETFRTQGMMSAEEFVKTSLIHNGFPVGNATRVAKNMLKAADKDKRINPALQQAVGLSSSSQSMNGMTKKTENGEESGFPKNKKRKIPTEKDGEKKRKQGEEEVRSEESKR